MDENGAESTEELHFFYDAQSRPAFVEYEGAMYRYVHNLQGDIVAIVDAGGNLVVEYKYDAWGTLLSTVAMYCIANNSYCGSAAGRSLVKIGNYNPITKAAIPVLALCLYLMIAPRYVYAGSTAISLKNDLRSIFREV